MTTRSRFLAALGALVVVAAAGSDGDGVVESESPVTTTTAAQAEAEPEPEAETTAVDGVAEVPFLIDLDEEEALAEIAAAGLVPEIIPLWVPPTDPRLGIVVTQSPDPFGWLPEGSVVKITVGE
ncbi:MAG: PASTA domain-containing protein [Actinomycetota bacterium]